ncbi:MAG TPA: glycosyltransferase family 1 protein [Gemmatimonadaceae bacterium]|nr:glycosyltransferase family 1 protein [Gemmatimonadaceae bacterium]
MRVGIDVSNFGDGLGGGTAVYLFNTIKALLEIDAELRLTLVCQFRPSEAGRVVLDALAGPRTTVRWGGLGTTGVPPNAWWYPWHGTVARVAGPVDIFHAGDFVWPLPEGTPVVASVLDLTTRLFPRYHTVGTRLRGMRKLRWAQRHADRMITISEATKRDLVQMCGADPERIDVTPLARGWTAVPAPDELRGLAGALRERLGIRDAPLVLTVGTLEPRKNHARLVHAFEGMGERFAGAHLVLAGQRGWKTGGLDEVLAASPARERIHVLGRVSPDELSALYSTATVFAYPSLYEGFGLPLLEAMAAGAPVITSNVSSLPEVAGDAALLVSPTSVEAIRHAIERLLADETLRADLARRGRVREREFTWRRTAELTLDSYRAAAGGRGGGRGRRPR